MRARLVVLLCALFAFSTITFCGTGNAEDLANWLPISSVTPGALNPAVNQSNIGKTICIVGYTTKIRPSSSYTTTLKKKQLISSYSRYATTLTSLVEEDHLIPLEIGGNPTDVRNLWPELWNGNWGAHKKDTLENKLHLMVCSHLITLAEAQQAFASNWIDAYNKYVLGLAPTVTATPAPTVISQVTPKNFVMPFFTSKIGLVLTTWNQTGFTLPPIVVQEKVPTGLACKPATDNDIIVKQDPAWKANVMSDTQVTLTIMCNAYVIKTSTPTPVATPTSVATPAPVATPTPLANPTPVATNTSSIPAGTTGICKDGTYSTAKTHSGMCSGHGGVAEFYP